MAFHEVRFPADISFGSTGGPERRTQVVTLANGHEERNTPWAQSRRRYDAGMGLRSLTDVAALVTFFEERRGRLHGFRWKDWTDWHSAKPGGEIDPADQVIGRGDGITRKFRLSKTYGAGVSAYVRPITKPVLGSVVVGVDGARLVEGVEFSIDATSGEITLVEAPTQGARITAGFAFDVPVRFDTDRIVVSVATFDAGQVPDVPVVEVRA